MEGEVRFVLAVSLVALLAGTTGGYRPKLLQPARNPLEVGCMADTPIILNHCVMVWPQVNKPTASIECRLGNFRTLNCSRTAVMFTGVPAGVHRLVITAQTATETSSAIYRLIIPADPRVCTTHLINRGVSVTNRTAVAEFGGFGPFSGFTCKLDNPTSFQCQSPLTLEGLSEGEHWLRVIPSGCREEQRQTFFFNISSSPSSSPS